MEHAQPVGGKVGNDVREDLEFVRAVVERGEHHEGPIVVYWLWGIVTFVGFAMNDFTPRWNGLYWAIAGPLAGVVTWLMMRRILRRFGISDRKESAREWLQWVGMAVVIVLLVFDAGRGKINGV